MSTNPLVGFIRKHPVRFWVSVAVVVVLAFLGYTVSRVASMALSLQEINGLTAQIGAHASEGDVEALAADLRLVQEHSSDAANTSEEWTVVLASNQPLFGNEITALRVVSVVASDISRSAGPLVDLLPRLSGDQLSDEDGFDLTLVENLDSAVSSLSTAVTTSSAKLKPLTERPMVDALQTRVTNLSDAIEVAGPGLDRVVPFIRALPIILGANGDRTWFVTMQNLTEARPSGGLLSAFVILDAKNGKLDMVAQGSNDTLEEGPDVPYESMPVGLQDLWGDYLGSWLSMNLSADFPENAELIANGWNERGEQQVSGVVSLGQGTVQYLAAAVGPVTVRDKTIQPADMVQYLSVDIYKDFTDPVEKDVVLAEIIGQIFDKLSAGEFDVQSLVAEALTGGNSDYLQLWSADAAEQMQIQNAGLSGSFSDAEGPTSSIRIINAGGNKLDAFLNLDATYELGKCVFDAETNSRTRKSTLTVNVTNSAPTSGLPDYMTGRVELEEQGLSYVRGSNHSYVSMYLPVNAVPGEFTLNGESAFVSEADERGHTFMMFDIELDPGASASLVGTWTEPAEDLDGNLLSNQPQLIMQPLLNTPSVSTEAAPKCS